MKPLNAEESGCSPISSNCVIWQGPDIECIKLCKGDSISAVVAKLATELCTLMEYTNVSNYDLACLNLTSCAPSNFQSLIQLLIDRICALDDCCGQTPITPGSGCPDCIVNICPDFYYMNPQGDIITTMQLVDYVQAIGNRVCGLIGEIATINAILQNYNIRITALENAPPPTFTLPQVTPICVLPSVPTDMNVVLAALESQFCALIGATGGPNNIYLAIQKQCAGLTGLPQLGGSGNMGSITGWQSGVTNLADAINNIWLTICDLRAAIVNIQTNCCPSGCSGIAIEMIPNLVGTNLTLYFTGTIPPQFAQCAPSGLTTVTVSDGVNTITQSFDLITFMNNLGGYTIGLPPIINVLNNLTITVTPCLYDRVTNTTCQSTIIEVVQSQALCPVMIYTPTDSTIGYAGSITNTVTNVTFTVQLWDATATILISSQSTVITVPPITPLVGTFVGLTPASIYLMRVTITPPAGATTFCPFTSVQMQLAACAPPTNLVPIIVLP